MLRQDPSFFFFVTENKTCNGMNRPIMWLGAMSPNLTARLRVQVYLCASKVARHVARGTPEMAASRVVARVVALEAKPTDATM